MWRSMLEPWGCTPQVTRGDVYDGMVCVLFVCTCVFVCTTCVCVCVGCELQYVCDCVEIMFPHRSPLCQMLEMC